MEKGVQHNPTTQLTWIPAASARNNQVEAGRRTNIASGTGLWGRSILTGWFAKYFMRKRLRGKLSTLKQAIESR